MAWRKAGRDGPVVEFTTCLKICPHFFAHILMIRIVEEQKRELFGKG